MFRGELIGIFVAPDGGAPMEPRTSVDVEAGVGIVGDRYALNLGTFSKKVATGRHVTLIEEEALHAITSDGEVALSPLETRRNLLTRGVPLNHLVGRTFRVGQVVLRGMRLCEPCSHLEKIVRPGLIKAATHRGGLRADVLTGGTLAVGAVIEPADP